jgi:hypothetical protein
MRHELGPHRVSPTVRASAPQAISKMRRTKPARLMKFGNFESFPANQCKTLQLETSGTPLDDPEHARARVVKCPRA